jgi:lipoate-protein ligase A
MLFLDRTISTLPGNLALDEALLLDAEAAGPEVLRVWEWRQPAVILGAGGRLQDDINVDACTLDNLPIARRSSGGGTVLLGPGCLVFSLVLRLNGPPELTNLHASYRFILGRLKRSLLPLAPGVELAGVSDLAIGGRKFSGNAQQRKQTHLLHHGTILYAMDLTSMSRYLKHPARQPDYRAQRGHAEFVGNIEVDVNVVKNALREEWNAHDEMRSEPAALADRLVAEKYGRDDWVRRR